MGINFVKSILNTKHLLAFLALVCVCIPTSTLAASLTLSPGSTSVFVGNISTVSIKVNTDGLPINNAEGVIQFPSDLLEVVSISKNSSIFTFWVEEPSFSNSTGRIVFNGGAANPGFNGSNGTIASVVFKAKKQGTASVLFTDGSVRKNDGLGTDILSLKSGSMITINQSQPIETPTEPAPESSSKVISKPVISSDTHPDQNRWYKATTATLSWKIPTNVNSIQTLFNKTSNSTPTISYDNSITQKTISNISDGISYFHLKFNGGNNSSATSHFVVKVDATPPDSFEPQVSVEENKIFVSLQVEDVTSGIDFYTIKIDNQPLQKIPLDQIINGRFQLPYQNEGNHNLIVTAFDRAGNQTIASMLFTSPSITTPSIQVSPSEIKKGESVTITGATFYPNSKVEIFFTIDNKELDSIIQTVSPEGKFSLVSDNFKSAGVVTVSVQSILGENVRSPFSEKVFLTISETKFEKTSFALLELIVIVLLLLILLVIMYIGWHKFFGLKRKINKELQKAVKDIHETTIAFKDELEEQLHVLEATREGRDLNKKEELIFKKIKKNIDDMDKFIEKKLKKLM